MAINHARAWQPRRLLAQAPFWLALTVLIWAAAQWAQLAWTLMTPLQNTAPLSPEAGLATGADASAAPALTPIALAERLAAAALFGRITTVTAAVVAPPVSPEVSETRLALTLRGVLQSDDPALARALIDAAGQLKAYGIGDEVADGARLEAIETERVLLRRGAALESLRLPRERVGGVVVTPYTAAEAHDAADPPASLQPLRQAALENPARLSEFMALTPVREDGKIKGFRIRARQDPRLLELAGLQPEDVVISVSGQPVTDPSALLTIQTALKVNQPLELVVERDGLMTPVSVRWD